MDTKIKAQRAITPKVGKPELQFMCSACCLMVFKVCVKFHQNMSSGFKVMVRTQKLLTYKRFNNSKSMKTRVTVHVFCMLSYGV